MKAVTYTYKFSNGVITISKGVYTKFDWYANVSLNDIQHEGYVEKQFIKLDQNLFLTKKHAIQTTTNLLQKFNLL